MTATPYRAVSWQPNELITEGKLDQLANNAQWLFENTPRANYRGHGVRKADGIRIACGLIPMPANKTAAAEGSVYFGNFFNTGCRPIITTGLISPVQKQFFISINGLGNSNTHPDNNGFQAHIRLNIQPNHAQNITKTVYVTWQAMGY